MTTLAPSPSWSLTKEWSTLGGLNKKGEAAEPGVCAYVCMYVCTILLYIIVLYSQKFSPISPLALFFCEFFVMYQGSAQNDLSGG